MNISWSLSITNARMHARELTVDEFMAAFAAENVRTQPTKDGPNYIAGRLLDYTKPRGKGNILDRCAVVLDCDDATPDTVKALVDAVKKLGVRSVVHSTYTSTPDKPRVRVVIPLKNVVVPGDYTSLCKALMNHLGMVTWDESCAQAERAMYMPAKREGTDNYWAEYADGPLMNGVEWLKNHTPASERKARTSKGNIAKRDKRRKPKNDTGIQGAFNRVYTIEDAIEEFDLPYEPCRDGRWTYYGAESQGGLRLVEGREDLCISEHANTDPACFIDGNGSVRALSAFELCAVHLYGEGDDTSVPPRERASMQAMAKRAAGDEAVQEELGAPSGKNINATDITWLFGNVDDVDLQARHVAKALRDKLLYCEGLGWLVYRENLGIWERTSESAALACIAPVVQEWYRASLSSGDDKFIQKTSKLRTAGGLRGLLTHVEAFATVPISTFDADPDLLCVQNGVVELRTSKLLSHSPKYYMTRQTACPYYPNAKHEAWDKALEALNLPENGWLKWWIGCAITGHQPNDPGVAVPILYGGGSNGKSVIMTALISAFGSYAHVGSQSLLMPTDAKDLLRACAFLMGIRLCIIEEAPDKMIHGNALKQMAATPTMKGEFKFKPEFTFNTTHSLMVSTNNKLGFDEGTNAVARRIAVLPFEKVYGANPNPNNDNEKLVDPDLLRMLQTPEGQAAILAWAVEGAKAYYDAGQHIPPATERMEAMKNEWLSNGDALSAFYNEMLIEDPEAMIPWTHLYAAFSDWQRERKGAPWNRSTFKGRMGAHRVFSGFKSGLLRTSGMDLYRGESSFGLKMPTGGRVAGLRGVRFRRDSDEPAVSEFEYVEPEFEAAPVEVPAVVAPERDDVEPAPAPVTETAPLIDVDDVPAITHHAALERNQLVEVINDLVDEVRCYPEGAEEVNRLTRETGAFSPAAATLGQMRALKSRLETSLIYWNIHYMFPGQRTQVE